MTNMLIGLILIGISSILTLAGIDLLSGHTEKLKSLKNEIQSLKSETKSLESQLDSQNICINGKNTSENTIPANVLLTGILTEQTIALSVAEKVEIGKTYWITRKDANPDDIFQLEMVIVQKY